MLLYHTTFRTLLHWLCRFAHSQDPWILKLPCYRPLKSQYHTTVLVASKQTWTELNMQWQNSILKVLISIWIKPYKVPGPEVIDSICYHVCTSHTYWIMWLGGAICVVLLSSVIYITPYLGAILTITVFPFNLSHTRLNQLHQISSSLFSPQHTAQFLASYIFCCK